MINPCRIYYFRIPTPVKMLILNNYVSHLDDLMEPNSAEKEGRENLPRVNYLVFNFTVTL